MTPGDTWTVAGSALLVLLAAVFSAAQAALSRMTVHRAAKLVEDGGRRARTLLRLVEHPVRTLNILALAVLLLQVTAVALVAVVADRHLPDAAAVALTVAAAGMGMFVVAEAAPKTLALQNTERVALMTAPLVAVFVRPLAPLARLLIGVANVVVPGPAPAGGPFVVTEDELREMIDVAEDTEIIEESEREMIHSIFELGDTVVREIMVPRPDMATVSDADSLSDVLESMLASGHSRLPVYHGDRDHIVGLVYAKDVLRRLHATASETGPWQDLLRSAHFVPELKPVDALLRELQAEKVHMAIVVDEYGATAGLVTIEDILEEIVGEIVDEYDTEEILVEALDENAWVVDARLPVDDLSKLVDSELPSEGWDTVGGLLFGMLGHVPSPGERVDVDSVRLVAERVKGRRISKVLVRRMPVPDPPAVGQDAR
ncbi:MAG TPA: hemolysin family protein [Egibacteraceae bacterium]|nr:hemolysin family protein [Egibacteraceae bacterium]